MNIKEMHIDFKKKLNKSDSQSNRNFLVPEIDWTINSAIRFFVRNISQPRGKSYLGFESNQRTRDDIRTLVIKDDKITVIDNSVALPSNYWFFIKGQVIIEKEGCSEKTASFFLRQFDDDFESSPFDRSSYKWRTVNGVMYENGIKLFDDTTFTNKFFLLSYIKEHPYVHNAEDYRSGTYSLPGGIVLTGVQNCILPSHTHDEIVDIAVLLASNELQIPDYQIKLQKLRMEGLNQ